MRSEDSHALDKSVTRFLPILIPGVGLKPVGKGFLDARTGGSAGAVFFQKGSKLETGPTEIHPVMEFVVPKVTPKRFAAMAKMFTLAAGEKIDSLILKDQLPHLFSDYFPENMVNALVRTALDRPRDFAVRWLEPMFNREIGAARLVMWSRPGRIFQPAIYCPNEETALFVHLLFAGISACLGCGKLFTPHRPNQLYHDLLCANRHRKRRERQRRTNGGKER
jgi:hypothetical protein